MSRPWVAKQKQEQRQDSRITNLLENKCTDYSVVLEEDREQTFHVFNLSNCRLERSWAANITRGLVSYKHTVAENGTLVGSAMTKCPTTQSPEI